MDTTMNSTIISGSETENIENSIDVHSTSDSTNSAESDSSNETFYETSNEEISNDSSIGGVNSSNNIELEDSNTVEYEDVDITPEKSGGVLKRMIKEGEGEDSPGYGDRVSVHYTGWRLGKEAVPFDSSRKGEKFEFNLGRGSVIKGWDLGVSTMKKGEIALFICHPKYAYGEMGYPPTIPPHTPLLFEIELFDWKLEDLSPKKDDSILRKVLDKGEGSTFPNEGSQIKVKIVTFIDEEILKEDEKDFILGEGCIANIPEGIELALYKFRLQERSLIYLKNKYANDVKGTAPDDSNVSFDSLKYEVTLLSFEKVKEVWEMNSDEKFEKAKLSKEKGISFYKMGHYKIALKQFKWIVLCLENEPGVAPENKESRKSLLLSGYLNIALCLMKLENYIDTIKICDKALEVDSNNEKALFRRGQAKVQINDCEEALQDFEKLCSLNPENKAARNSIILCQDKIKQQKLKDKSTYNKMFEIFVKQDEERLKSMKTETGVWQGEKREEPESLNETERFLNESNTTLLDANVIEISNTANDNKSYNHL